MFVVGCALVGTTPFGPSVGDLLALFVAENIYSFLTAEYLSVLDIYGIYPLPPMSALLSFLKEGRIK